MVSNLDRALNWGHRQTDVIIMDFAKAFDKVQHKRLLYKLHVYGIRGSTHKWIALWLSECYQKVLLDVQASDPVPVLFGLPQGSVLGPVLFLIFINDLPDNIRSSVRLFADDCVLYRNINSLTDCQILHSCSFGLRYVSWYKYLIVSLVFSHLGFWSGNLFLIAPFPDLCLLVPFYKKT